MDNALVLSEELEENAVQTLIRVALDDLFPEPCEKLRITSEDIRARYRQEFTKRQDAVCQEIAKGEDSLRRGLREVVVEDVLKLFPYVYRRCRMWHNDDVFPRCRSLERDNLSVRVGDSGDPNASQEAAGRVFPCPVLNPSHGFQVWCGCLISNRFTLGFGPSIRGTSIMPGLTPH
jgi:hypothetical protein